MYHRFFILLVPLFFFSLTGYAQKEGNIWYFGLGAGINFNVSPPEVLLDGKIYTREGVATISDKKTGQLLFYTEGTKIWDKNQQVMPNGSGLKGDYSSTQSAVIVPHPGNPAKYYVFTTAQNKGFRYSEVDMSLHNGMGDVIPGTKNKLLLPGSKSTEKVIATRHCNGKDYWVATHTSGDDAFYVYLITAAGIQSPHIYHVGSVIHAGGWEMTSYLKFSPDGNILANVFGSPDASQSPSKVEFFAFNNQTGVLTGPTLVLEPFIFPYGIEFSPDGNLVYISTLHGQSIFQYDLSASDVTSTRTEIASSSHLLFGALQLGPDGKIYVSSEDGFNNGYPYLGVINQPDVVGKGCDFVQDGFYLGGRETLIGLPTFLGSIFYHPEDFNVENVCYETPTRFDITNIKNIDSVYWSFGDGGSSKKIAASHLYGKPGNYDVQLIIYSPCRSDTVNKTVSICASKDKMVEDTICEGEPYLLPDGRKVTKSGEYVSLQKNACGCDIKIITRLQVNPSYHITVKDSICPGAAYKLPDGRMVNEPGVYTSKLQTIYGCDSVIVTQLFVKKYVVTHRYDTICTHETFTLPDGRAVNQTGLYKLVYNAKNGCDSLVLYHLKVIAPPAIHLGKDFCIVPGEVVKLQPTIRGGEPLWQDGSDLSAFEVRAPGIYWVKVDNSCGIAADTVVVTNDCLGRVFVPTAFTPNHDGQNDVFKILNVHGQRLIRFDIFDRWGKKVFHTNDIYEGWTGEGANLGSYVYYIKLHTLKDEIKIIKGAVTLIR